MTRLQADTMMSEYGPKIHNKTYNNKLISGVFVVPLGNDQIQEIIYELMNYRSSEIILNKYSDFDVAVIFDYKDYLVSGVLDYKPLVLLLPEILDAK